MKRTCTLDGCMYDDSESVFEECPICRLNRIIDSRLEKLKEEMRKEFDAKLDDLYDRIKEIGEYDPDY